MQHIRVLCCTGLVPYRQLLEPHSALTPRCEAARSSQQRWMAVYYCEGALRLYCDADVLLLASEQAPRQLTSPLGTTLAELRARSGQDWSMSEVLTGKLVLGVIQVLNRGRGAGELMGLANAFSATRPPSSSFTICLSCSSKERSL